jgi:hypothetical protein
VSVPTEAHETNGLQDPVVGHDLGSDKFRTITTHEAGSPGSYSREKGRLQKKVTIHRLC